jgi:hypothetical protein
MIRAENFRNFFDDIRIQTADRSADDDDRRDADDDADQSQKSAQFMLENRFNCNPKSVGKMNITAS